MLGYCPVCDDYHTFQKNGDMALCSHCGVGQHYEMNGSQMVEHVECQINGMIVTLEPVLLKAVTHAPNWLETVDVDKLADVFQTELQPVKTNAAKLGVSIPVLLVLEPPNRATTLATVVFVNPDGTVISNRVSEEDISVPIPPLLFKYAEYLESSF